MLKVFLGFDSREIVAYHVLAHSIIRNASGPVAIIPLRKELLSDVYTRPHANQSTEFTYSRFLVPYLCDYKGMAVFLDCDMLVTGDIYEITKYAAGYSVAVCKHDYTPKTTKKFLGSRQTAYHRKNWSSVMVFKNARCRMLTPHVVNTMEPMKLHQFAWLKDSEIGSIPLEWNWLVGEYENREDVKNFHWTIGGPYFKEYKDAPFADLWNAEKRMMLSAGRSADD